jgi:thymidine kinase
MSLDCVSYDEDFSFESYLANLLCHETPKRVFLIDEAQFLSKKQVLQLVNLCEIHCIDVICYGLKTDFRTIFFEGSEVLLRYAHKIETLRSVPCFC